MNKFPIIALDHTRWKGNWMNRQHILSRLGKRGWPIIYSNGARFYNETDEGDLFNRCEYIDHINLFSTGYFIPRNYKSATLDNIAINYHCKKLKANLGIKQSEFFIVLCFNPDFYPYIEKLSPHHTFFHIYDVYQGMEGCSNSKNNYQQQLIAASSVISAASEQMWDSVVGETNKEKNIIHNGVDLEFFNSKTTSTSEAYKTVQALPGYKIGYIGTINSKIDFSLVYELAKLKPEIQFIFGGNIRHKQLKANTELNHYYLLCTKTPNIHFIGTIDRHDVPCILKLMDINAIYYHQHKDSWVNAGYPIKINEYLAVGKPVITSYMPSLDTHFKGAIKICQTQKQWISGIEDLLAYKESSMTTTGLALAKKNDWNNRVDKIEQLLLNISA